MGSFSIAEGLRNKSPTFCFLYKCRRERKHFEHFPLGEGRVGQFLNLGQS